uniref:HL04357p n=1 Tax=Drosophila melanogaster TaxID=7227 RepID=Q95S02_DROME
MLHSVVKGGCQLAVELQQATQSPKVSLVLQEKTLHCAIGPELHCVRQQLHGNGVNSQKVAHKDDLKWVCCSVYEDMYVTKIDTYPIDLLIQRAHPCYGADIIRYGDQSGVGQIFA